MTSQGSPYGRFQRCLATGNPLLVDAAAAELPRISLEDALAICLVYVTAGDRRAARALTRWLGHLLVEARPPLSPEQAITTLGSLLGLSGASRAGAARTLVSVCEAHGQPSCADTLDRWRGAD